MPWPCTWCGQSNAGFSQNRDPAEATAAELADELARHDQPHGISETRDQAEAAPRPGRRLARRVALLAVLAGACAAVAVTLVAARSPMAAGMATRQGGGVTRTVHVTEGQVGGIDFQGAQGRLTIVSARSSQVVLTGQVHGTTSAPAVKSRFDRARDVLMVSVWCASGSGCSENLRLAVPVDTRATVRQSGGQIVVAGLSAPLSITAKNVDISASGLRSPDLVAVITSGHLSAAFTVPPRRITVMLASAQATIRTSAHAVYRVTQQVMSGHIDVAIPQAGDATRVVTARVDSGELELLPS